MDNNLMELWGNFFLTAAKGQKQAGELSKMARDGLWGMPDPGAAMSGFSGMEAFEKATREYFALFARVNEEIQKAVKDYLALTDLVPRSDYLALREEFEAYRKSVEEKGSIGSLLGEEMSLQKQGLRNFEELVRNQTRQFQDLMADFTQFMSPSQTRPSSAQGENKPRSKKGPQKKGKGSARAAGPGK